MLRPSVTIANGHTITIAASTSVTVGDSANPATAAIRTAGTGGTGILIIGSGATLTVKGRVQQGNATWTVNSGATIHFLHASTALDWQIGDAGTQANAKLVLSGGTGASRITIDSTGATNAKGFGNSNGTDNVNAGRINATGVQFTNIGSSANELLRFRPSSTGSPDYTFDDCLFTSCGVIANSHAFSASAIFRLLRCTFRTPLNSSGQAVQLVLDTTTPTGERCIESVASEGRITASGGGGTTAAFTITNVLIQGNTSAAPIDISGTPAGMTVDLLMLFNKVTAAGVPSRIMNGTITRLMSERQGQSTDANGHAMTINLSADTTINGGIWSMGAEDESGDQFQIIANPATSKSLSITNVISPPTPGGTRGSGAGAFVNISASGAVTNLLLTFDHNTSFVSNIGGGGSDSAGCLMSENTTGGAGVIVSARSNLWYRTVSGNGWGVFHKNGTITAGTFTNVDFNARYLLNTDGYEMSDATFSTPSPPGTNDITVNPRFVDSSRNLLKWGQTINASLTTRQQVIDELMKLNDDSGYNSGYTLAAYYDWVRAGFAPTNSAYHRKGNGATTIGAIEYVNRFHAISLSF